jgi:hypothetical protein
VGIDCALVSTNSVIFDVGYRVGGATNGSAISEVRRATLDWPLSGALSGRSGNSGGASMFFRHISEIEIECRNGRTETEILLGPDDHT